MAYFAVFNAPAAGPTSDAYPSAGIVMFLSRSNLSGGYAIADYLPAGLPDEEGNWVSTSKRIIDSAYKGIFHIQVPFGYRYRIRMQPDGVAFQDGISTIEEVGFFPGIEGEGGAASEATLQTRASEATLLAFSNKTPAGTAAMPNFGTVGLPVRQLPQKIVATSYATAGADVDAANEVLIATGAGMTVNRTAGNLVITSGTTANSETVIRSLETCNGRNTFSHGDTLSQRIANNNFFRELVDVIGDGLAYTIVNSTTVNVTRPDHGFTDPQSIGQRMDICALSSVGVPGEVVIQSIPNVDTLRLTVVGWPATGSGTCSLTGLNKIELNFTGTVATAVNINSRRRGYQNISTVMTCLTTLSGVHHTTTTQNDRIVLANGALAVGAPLVDRSVIFTNIVEPDVPMYYQLRARNGTVAPASSTTWTCAFTRIQDFIATQIEITGMRNFGTGTTMPVSGAVSVSGSITATAAASNVRTGFVANSGQWLDDTSTVLAANATFTGTARDLANTATATTFGSAAVFAKEYRTAAESDVAGTLWLEVSRDNVNWRRINSVATAAIAGGGQYAEIVHRPSWRYARSGFTNGATLQARFTLNSIMMAA